MNRWFTIDKIDAETYIISEYRHWEETHCYLLNGGFPLSMETVREMVADRCDLPDGFDVNDYELFQGMPTKVLVDSLEKISALPVRRVFPAHHSLEISPEILIHMRDAFRQLKAEGKLHHGSGTFHYGEWGVRL